MAGSHAARPIRFGIVGAVTFAIQIAGLTLFTNAGLGSLVAYMVSLVISVEFNFVVNQLLVWHDRPVSRVPRRLLHRWATFHGAIALSLVINVVAFALAEPFMPDIAAAVVGLAASTVIKFLSLDRPGVPLDRPALGRRRRLRAPSRTRTGCSGPAGSGPS